MSTHPFDQALALQALGENHFRGHTSAAYANMVGPFGGLSAAQALQAVLQHPERLGEPVSLTVNFCAALADGPFDVQARPLRTNRSTQHWLVEVLQGEQVCTSATVLTALRRDGWGTLEHAAPAVPAPEQVALPQGPARVEWVKRYEFRFIEGGFPPQWDGSDSGHSRTRLWVRDNPPRVLDFASLTALADVFLPRIWRRRASFVPLGTVTMTVYFHASAQDLTALGAGAYILAQAQGQAFRNGYFDHAAQLWSQAGALLASTHQLVYYKE